MLACLRICVRIERMRARATGAMERASEHACMLDMLGFCVEGGTFVLFVG